MAPEAATQPALLQSLRSAALKDPECEPQWELPFAMATAYGWDTNEKVAWVRALGVDERLTVVAATPESPLRLGDRIVKVKGKADGGVVARGGGSAGGLGRGGG